MKAREIKDRIYWMGSVDWDSRLFDSLISLPDGTSYNAYLIEGSGKTVETLAGMIPNLKVEVIDPVLCKGVPAESAFKALDDLAATIAQKHKEHDFI